MKKTQLDTDTGEWIAALASTIHETGNYDELYIAVRGNCGGFPGLWSFWAAFGYELARKFEGVSIEDFPEIVQWLTHEVLLFSRQVGTLPNASAREEIIDRALSTYAESIGPLAQD